MTSEDVYDIKRWHKDGKEINIIAQLLGVTRKDVREVLGLPDVAKEPKQFNVPMIVNDWNAGKDADKIVKTYGFTDRDQLYTFNRRMRKEGYKIANRRDDRRSKLDRMVVDWNADMPVLDIVKKYGYKDRTSICNAIHYHRKQGKPFKIRNGGVEKRRNNERGVT